MNTLTVQKRIGVYSRGGDILLPHRGSVWANNDGHVEYIIASIGHWTGEQPPQSTG